MTPYDKYLELNSERKSAEKWSMMAKNGGGRNGDSFKISPIHSNIKLTRCGQYDTGGKNYWESSKAFNEAMIQWICNNIDIVQEGALDIMRAKEKQALLQCEEFVNEIQKNIYFAKMEK